MLLKHRLVRDCGPCGHLECKRAVYARRMRDQARAETCTFRICNRTESAKCPRVGHIVQYLAPMGGSGLARSITKKAAARGERRLQRRWTRLGRLRVLPIPV